MLQEYYFSYFHLCMRAEKKYKDNFVFVQLIFKWRDIIASVVSLKISGILNRIFM